MNYLEFFGFNEDPFKGAPDTSSFYPSATHKDALTSLDFVVTQNEGFFVATGEPGTGKTTVLRHFVNTWKDRAEIALILTPKLSPKEFLYAVLDDLGVKYKHAGKNEALKTFRNFLIQKVGEGKKVIIIVDEAHLLPDDTIEDLRLLSNLETEKEKMLQIILVGQSELKAKLSSEKMRHLNQRIGVAVEMKPLSKSNTADYISCKLLRSGEGTVTFADGAKDRIHKFTNGIPRLINMVTSRALMAAYLAGSKTVTKEHVQQAIKHLNNISVNARNDKKSNGMPPSIARIAAAVLLVASIFAAFIFGRDYLSPYIQPSVAQKKIEPQTQTGEAPVRPAPAQSQVKNASDAVQSQGADVERRIDR